MKLCLQIGERGPQLRASEYLIRERFILAAGSEQTPRWTSSRLKAVKSGKVNYRQIILKVSFVSIRVRASTFELSLVSVQSLQHPSATSLAQIPTPDGTKQNNIARSLRPIRMIDVSSGLLHF